MYNTLKGTMYIVANEHKKRKTNAATVNIEAEASKYLNYRWFFDGESQRYIWWRIGDSVLQDDGSWETEEDGWREADLKDKPFGLVEQHLKGAPRGITWVGGKVPCLVQDLDNHEGQQYSADDQIARMRYGLGQLKRLLPSMSHVADINPRDGSVALLSFDPKFRPLNPRLSDTVYEAVEPMLGQIEVFPYQTKGPGDPRPNCRSRRLPLQPDRILVVGSRILEKVNRPRRSQDGNYISEEYSPSAFIKAVNDQENADSDFVASILRTIIKQKKRPATDQGTPTKDTAAASSSDTTAAQFGNALDRQYKALAPFARRLCRVPTVEEALDHLKKSKCFSGSWNATLRTRTRRVRDILKIIGRTFDAAKCRGVKSKMTRLNQFMTECRSRLMHSEYRVELFGRRGVDEFGNEFRTKGKIRYVKREHAQCLAAILMLLIEQNEDGGIPRKSIEGYWNDLHGMGLLPKWNPDYYLACRDVAVRVWGIKIDPAYWKDHAKTAEILPENDETFDHGYEYPQTTYNTPHLLNCGDANENDGDWDRADFADPRPPPDG